MPPDHHSPLRISLLTEADGPALLQFEQENRDFFAQWVPDRGNAYFAEFEQRLQALVAENRSGSSLLFVVRDTYDDVVGRVNLADANRGSQPELGYRIAENAAGQGVATRSVAYALDQARNCGFASVRAMTTEHNIASQRVLERTGFQRTTGGLPAEVTLAGGRHPTVHYIAHLARL